MANAKVTITIKTNCAYFSTVFELHSVLVFMKCMLTLYGKRIGKHPIIACRKLFHLSNHNIHIKD